jgi:AraC-like DNA-binding protein
VMAIAGRWGFGHAGRFSSMYKRTFGTSPSRTLRS